MILGSEHRTFAMKRLEQIEESMRRTYAAVAKNEHDRLEHSMASYVLHRLFLQRHAWSVLGLDPAGASIAGFNSSTATRFLENRVPWRVLELFEDCGGGRGFGLQELSVLAAALECLVHKEAIDRLTVAYRTHSFSPASVLNDTRLTSSLCHPCHYEVGRKACRHCVSNLEPDTAVRP